MGLNVTTLKIVKKPAKQQSDCHVCFLINYAPQLWECCQEISAFYLNSNRENHLTHSVTDRHSELYTWTDDRQNRFLILLRPAKVCASLCGEKAARAFLSFLALKWTNKH